MNVAAEYTFRTKTGTCTITPQRISLTREGARGTLSQWLIGDSIRRALTVSAVVGAVVIVFGVRAFLNGNNTLGVVTFVIGLLFLRDVVVSRNNSAAPIIERSTIRDVEVHPPKPPVARGYFTVVFEEGGKLRKRLIMLPGSFEGGRAEFEKAHQVLRTSGLVQ